VCFGMLWGVPSNGVCNRLCNAGFAVPQVCNRAANLRTTLGQFRGELWDIVALRPECGEEIRTVDAIDCCPRSWHCAG